MGILHGHATATHTAYGFGKTKSRATDRFGEAMVQLNDSIVLGLNKRLESHCLQALRFTTLTERSQKNLSS